MYCCWETTPSPSNASNATLMEKTILIAGDRDDYAAGLESFLFHLLVEVTSRSGLVSASRRHLPPGKALRLLSFIENGESSPTTLQETSLLSAKPPPPRTRARVRAPLRQRDAIPVKVRMEGRRRPGKNQDGLAVPITVDQRQKNLGLGFSSTRSALRRIKNTVSSTSRRPSGCVSLGTGR